MKKEIYFEMVENLLKNFPKECTQNYFTNKETLTIIEKPRITEGILRNYNQDTNTIYFSEESSLPHELFHMSFSDKNKLKQEIYSNNDITIYYSNGISVKIKTKNNEAIYNNGLTEGFAEYLHRKCLTNKGQQLNYFFTNLLISIHGEEIIKYSLTNDPTGFFSDKRFYNIKDIAQELDSLDFHKKTFLLIGAKESITKILNSTDKDELNKFKSLIKQTKNNFSSAILSLFKLIITEYKNCQNPKITKKELIEKMESFLTDDDYKFIYILLKSHNIENKIIKIITKFKKEPNFKKIFKKIKISNSSYF